MRATLALNGLIEIVFEWKVTMNQKMKTKPSFFYFCCKTYVYVFQTLFNFFSFQATSCFLQKLGTYSFDSTLNLLSSLYACTLKIFSQFTIISIGTIYSKEITTSTNTTTTATTANNQVNENSGPGSIIQIVGKGHKCKYKLRKQGRYMQTHAPHW